MEISSASIWALAFVVLLNTVFIAGLAACLFMINRKVNEALDKAAPLIEKASQTLGRVDEAAVHLQQKVDYVLDKTTTLVDQVSERVDTTTAVAEEVVTEPLIGAASLMAGIQQGLRTYKVRASDKGEEHNGGH